MMASMKQWATEAISTGWVWGPLVAYYAPRGLFSMYCNKHLRRYARRLVPFLDPFVSVDIVSTRGEESGQSSNNAYKEVEAYLTKVCMRDAHAFCAEGTVEGCSGFSLSLSMGQEVTDDFRGVTVWWLSTKTKTTSDWRDTTCFRLMFPQQHRELILDEYLPHVRRAGREDLFVTIDIVDEKNSDLKFSDAFEEVKAYLNSACSRHAHDLNAHGTVRSDSFLFSLRKGQEVADNFRGVTLRWLSTAKKSTTGDWRDTTCFRLIFPQQHRMLILDEYLPHVRRTGRENLFVTIDIIEEKKSIHHTSDDLKLSEAFEEVKAYLNSACTRDAHDLYAHGTVRGDSFLFSLRQGGEVSDNFSGVTLRWSSPKPTNNWGDTTSTCFRLEFPKQHRALILDEYLPHVRRQGHSIMISKRGQRLFSNSNRRSNYQLDTSASWSHIDFEHPTTFDTLAMHPNKKRKIMEDLDNFRRNKDYYRRIGKPWKRGYFLFGPPGTGKSTMIAAMANYLNYDVYDMELTSVSNNSDLRSLLVEIPGKSIIVFEDIDCCFDDVTSQRSNQEGGSTLSRYCNDNDSDRDKDKSKVTLSGLLNFIDGVWSAQTGERIIVFTTNFRDKLDQALIRCGRMDMHIEMSYCCFETFKMLAKNYLGVKDDRGVKDDEDPLYKSVDELLKVVEITPAEVAECFLRSRSDFASSDRGVEQDTCIKRLIEELEKKAALSELEKKAAQPKKRQRRRH